MILDKMAVGSYAANCYFLVDESTLETFVIDPGSEAKRIVEHIQKKGYQVSKILLTHGHGDHIGAADELRKVFSVPIAIHSEDAKMLECHTENLSHHMEKSVAFSADESLNDRAVLTLGKSKIKVIHTPGHTQGGVCFFVESENILISGDTLFYGSVGRSDLPGGNHKQLIQSIIQNLMTLKDDVVVYPGHGSSTSIGFERKKNPFIQG